MSGLGPRPELRWLPVDRLRADARYQRGLESRASQNLIAKIEHEFRWFKFQAILAAPADDEPGWWNILDGQHRVAGVRRRGDIPEVPGLVISEGDWQTHAAAFVGANRNRVAVNPFAMHRARLAARDPEALTIAAFAEHAGIIIPTTSVPETKMKPGETASLGAFVRIPERYGPAVARAAFRVVADAFRDEPGGMRAVFFDAVARVIFERGGISPPELLPVLRRTTAAALLDEIHLRRGRVGGTMLTAAAAVIGLRLAKAGAAPPETSRPTRVSAKKVAASKSRPQTPPPLKRQPSAAAWSTPAPRAPLGGGGTTNTGLSPTGPSSDPRRAEIDAFIARKGVTQVAPAYLAPTQAGVSEADAKRRIADMKLPEPEKKKSFYYGHAKRSN